jgi:hypothetical protein
MRFGRLENYNQHAHATALPTWFQQQTYFYQVLIFACCFINDSNLIPLKESFQVNTTFEPFLLSAPTALPISV